MSLFPNAGYSNNRRTIANPYRSMQPQPQPQPQTQHRLPNEWGRLNVICTCRDAHHLPIRMKFIGFSWSDKGASMAVYACPYHGCNWREAYVQDYRTGQPRCLFGKKFDNHR